MHIDGWVAIAGLVVGFTVGLTGMGGGALMTPLLVLVFKVQPLAAVSSDLVAAMVMKPVGGSVHLRRGTVNRSMVLWLCVGSVPTAFLGVVILDALGDGTDLQNRIKTLLGATLLIAAVSILGKAVLAARRQGDDRAVLEATAVPVRKVPTVLIGMVGGLVVGMTSVGSGSIMIVLLMFLYPRLKASQLVGTDLVQAVPLVASAAIGHLIFGGVELGLTTSLLIGSIPGVYLGARLSAKAPDHVIRPALLFVLTASALKLLGLGNTELGLTLGALIVVAIVVALVLRRRATVVAVDPEPVPAVP